EYGGTIQEQQRKLGCSCDWDRKRFTMDEGLSEAVLEQFINLYNKGLIYKGKKMINWCPSCHTTISDAEVEYEDEASHLWHIKYQIKGTDKFIVVATTRPETMLGDTAVAVHPEDKRYKDLIGKKCILPIMNKEIPIIADEFVEKEFGTGCVKITPAHDPNDYQAGLRNNLEIVEVFDDSSIMGDLVPEYKGMKSIDARKEIVKKLEEIGALVKIEDYTHNVGKCYRCHNTIEPRISEQWFVSMKELAKKAADCVRNDEVRFVPKRYEKMYFNWLDNIQDWCISRQLWWGHRIPVYYCKKCGNMYAAKQMPEKCEKCGSTELYQDEDSLDTWFSSALWPFSTLGWPNTETEDYKTFYPTNVLVTGYDIITFWVSRMMTQGLELTNKKPFSDILVHGIVRDAQGRKMSKSLGNGIDPIEIIDKYGTDALRLSLIMGITPGNDIRYMPEKLEAASNFANKLWNASKFVLMNLEEENFDNTNIDIEKLQYEDKWILSKLNTLIQEATTNLDNYDMGVYVQKIYDFTRNEFCDWYIEMVKTRLYNKESREQEDIESRIIAQKVLNKVLCDILKLLHPIMPFITERIYKELYNNDESIMIGEWPTYNKEYEFKNEETHIEEIKQIISQIRNIRTNANVHPSKKSELIFITDDQEYEKLLETSKGWIEKLGFSDKITIEKDETNVPKHTVSALANGIKVFIPFEELVNVEEERAKLQAEIERLEAEVERSTKMLSNPGFVNKAPEAKVQEEKEKMQKYKDMLADTKERLTQL
ncbi:MAG: valine--tRNA ligase, partial [Clostridia bacterium]